MRWSGASWAKPVAPSLNQVRRRTSALVKMSGGMGLTMPGRLVSPSATMNRPFVTGTVMMVTGVALPSWLQSVTVVPVTRTSVKRNWPEPEKFVPCDVTRPW